MCYCLQLLATCSFVAEEKKLKTPPSQKRKAVSATTTKKKDNVKRPVKTAPVKLASIVASKTPVQHRTVVSGVTKRLTKRYLIQH